jgi:hypothetical protein
MFDYTDIKDYVKNIFVDHYITDENARIEVQNGSGTAGAGQVVKSLKAAHYNVTDPTNAADHYTQTVIYDYTGGKKPYTINYLEQRFGVKAIKAPSPSPSTDATGATITGSRDKDYSWQQLQTGYHFAIVWHGWGCSVDDHGLEGGDGPGGGPPGRDLAAGFGAGGGGELWPLRANTKKVWGARLLERMPALLMGLSVV